MFLRKYQVLIFRIALTSVLGAVAVLAVGSVYMLICLAASLCVLWPIQRRYITTSSQLRTLQIAAQAPVLALIRAGFEGRCTIRAFGLRRDVGRRLIGQVYQSQKPGYLFRSLQTWLLLVLDLLSAGVAGALAALLVGLRARVNVGWAGVALVNTIALGQDLKLLTHWLTTFETSLGVIRRIREFLDSTPREDGGRSTEPDQWWPSAGEVSIQNVSCSYG